VHRDTEDKPARQVPAFPSLCSALPSRQARAADGTEGIAPWRRSEEQRQAAEESLRGLEFWPREYGVDLVEQDCGGDCGAQSDSGLPSVSMQTLAFFPISFFSFPFPLSSSSSHFPGFLLRDYEALRLFLKTIKDTN
jgi:hypothetical protein